MAYYDKDYDPSNETIYQHNFENENENYYDEELNKYITHETFGLEWPSNKCKWLDHSNFILSSMNNNKTPHKLLICNINHHTLTKKNEILNSSNASTYHTTFFNSKISKGFKNESNLKLNVTKYINTQVKSNDILSNLTINNKNYVCSTGNNNILVFELCKFNHLNKNSLVNCSINLNTDDQEVFKLSISDNNLYSIASNQILIYNIENIRSTTTTYNSKITSEFEFTSLDSNKDLFTVSTSDGSLIFYDIRSQSISSKTKTFDKINSINLGRDNLILTSSTNKINLWDIRYMGVKLHFIDEENVRSILWNTIKQNLFMSYGDNINIWNINKLNYSQSNNNDGLICCYTDHQKDAYILSSDWNCNKDNTIISSDSRNKLHIWSFIE